MALTRNWTDPRDAALWLLRRGFGVDPGVSRLFFTRGAERRTVLVEREADLGSLTGTGPFELATGLMGSVGYGHHQGDRGSPPMSEGLPATEWMGTERSTGRL